MTPAIDVKSLSVHRCLLCYESVPASLDHRKKPFKDVLLRNCSDLDITLRSQLSSFFLVRNILGLPKDFLEGLLGSYGNPSDWELKLCRICKRRFEEAELLWDRMSQLQRDYEKVTFEIKDTLVGSLTDEEMEGLNKENESNNLKEKSNSKTILGKVRLKFFAELQAQCEDESQQRIEVPELVSANLCKSSQGVPYLTYKLIEDKLKDLIRTSGPLHSENLSDANEVQPKETLHSQLNGHVESKPEASSSSSSVISEKPFIKIVSYDTLRDESEDNEDTDSLPVVQEAIKHEFAEDPMDIVDVNASGEIVVDPLSPDNNDKDPDYLPEIPEKDKVTIVNINKNKGDMTCRLDKLEFQPKKKGPGSYECTKCSVTFEARLGCWVHILKDHYGERNPYHCQICRKKFKLFFPLRQHVLIVHDLKSTAYDEDPVSQDEVEKLPLPEMTNSKVTRFIYVCPACNETFPNKKQAVVHFKATHPDKTIPRFKPKEKTKPPEEFGFECTICSGRKIQYRAPTQDMLESHYKKVHQFQYQYMEKRNKLKTKIVSKTQNPPAVPTRNHTIKCTDCGTVFSAVSDMAEHLNKPDHKCSECPKHFQFDYELRQHLNQAHFNRSFQCPYCPKMFSTLTVYEKHIENHQTFDSHQCEVCQTKVTGYPTLVRHMQVSHPDYNPDQVQEPQTQQNDIVGNPAIFGI